MEMEHTGTYVLPELEDELPLAPTYESSRKAHGPLAESSRYTNPV
jgi:hypothetical protein